MAFSHEWHRSLIADCIDALQDNRQFSASGRQALQVHKLIDALVLSSNKARAINIK